MYVDFTYYQSTYGGTAINADSFIKYERKARIALDNFTFNRLKDDNTLITNDVKDCLCEMMEKAYGIEQEEAATDGKTITSESVDGHSVSFAISDSQKNEIDQSRITKIKLYNIAKDYLGNTGLLYRGLN